MAAGIRRLHSRNCPAKARPAQGWREHCKCQAGWEASVFSPRDGAKLRRTFKNQAEARSWRADAKRSLDHGTLRVPGRETLRQAAEEWLDAIESGAIKNRDGNRFKPATLRGYRQALQDYVLPLLGGERLASITTADIQALIDRWEAEGQEPATTRNAIKPLQSLYRRARSRGRVTVNPTSDLELPAQNPRKAEIVTPEVAQHLVSSTPEGDRPIWAAAVYAGLRYGELRALRWGAVDLASGQIHVRESWDPKAGPIEPKTATSRRTVPVSGALRDCLLDHRLRKGEPDPGALIFEKSEGKPFDAVSIYRRADKAWEAAGFDKRLRLHQARHTCASFWIAAGLDPKTVMTYMGHSSITVTFDLYGHLIPGSMDDDRAKLDAFLNQSDTAGRIRALDHPDAP